ncbi:MAG: hypothetical protein H8E54_03855 [Candidatus Aminicenantes bacterium]|nr:hypothetical protein [Candidatus Aminicenantes bacterium]
MPAEATRRTRTSDILSSVPPEENGVIIEEFFFPLIHPWGRNLFHKS